MGDLPGSHMASLGTCAVICASYTTHVQRKRKRQ
jgi:hypothetical protein